MMIGDNSAESGSHTVDETGHQARTQTPGAGPHQKRTRNWKKFLEDRGLLVERVLLVLQFMESQQIDLAILLWAISWNVPELTSHDRVRFMRTSLMVSDELPVILSRWYQPPRNHGAGIRTKGASAAMQSWAIETVCNTVDQEMAALKNTMDSPQQELTEESLLGIKWNDMINEVKINAPTMWTLFRHASYTPKQDSRNKNKNPDPVNSINICSQYY
jgi:hypothetical protein